MDGGIKDIEYKVKMSVGRTCGAGKCIVMVHFPIGFPYAWVTLQPHLLSWPSWQERRQRS
jgi:hypothetical protein